MSDNLNITDPNPGDLIIKQLKKWGSDVTQTHKFTFWLYFPEEQLAKYASLKAENAGFEVETSPLLKDEKSLAWLCLLYCPHVPDEELLAGIVRFCIKLAEEFDGKFDGWETRLELPEGTIPEGLPGFNDWKKIEDLPV